MKKTIIILAVLVSVILQSCKQDHEHQKENEHFIVTHPLRKDTVFNKEYVSQVKSFQHIELRAIEKGYLQKIYVDEGQFVKKGQLLFQIIPVVYQAEAQKSLAELKYTEIEFQNTKSLNDSNIVSKNELALSRAKMEKAKAEYELAKARLGFTEIRAPFDGMVGRFNNVRVGSLLDEGELLTTLSDNSKMWVYFNVPEAEYLNYTHQKKSGNPVTVKLLMANNELFNESGIIETIEADFNNETGNIAFRATFMNPDLTLRHGETGKVLMPVKLRQALLIPQEATYEVLDKIFVFTVDKNNVVNAKEVTVNHELPHLFSVVNGLNDDDRILVEGIRKVKNGDKIEVKLKPLNEILSELKNLKAE
jgi:membrane fusion protein, multidrug efflux system